MYIYICICIYIYIYIIIILYINNIIYKLYYNNYNIAVNFEYCLLLDTIPAEISMLKMKQ